jgi:hypothetical protein
MGLIVTLETTPIALQQPAGKLCSNFSMGKYSTVLCMILVERIDRRDPL